MTGANQDYEEPVLLEKCGQCNRVIEEPNDDRLVLDTPFGPIYFCTLMHKQMFQDDA